MNTLNNKEILIYQHLNGREPFWKWFKSLKNKYVQNRVIRRLNKLKQGYYGDYKIIGNGVFELRLPFGPGYRIYFGEQYNTIIVLLCGGDKSTQFKDIQKAKYYWKLYNEKTHH